MSMYGERLTTLPARSEAISGGCMPPTPARLTSDALSAVSK